MFTTDFKNSSEGIISSDISKEAFEHFIRFIYTGEAASIAKYSQELLKIAHKYEMQDLKAACERQLIANLTEDTAAALFQSAHQFNCNDDLKEASFDFIRR